MDSLVLSSLNQNIYDQKDKRDEVCVSVMEMGDKTQESVTNYLACIIQTFLPLWFDWDIVLLPFSTRLTEVQKTKVVTTAAEHMNCTWEYIWNLKL